LRSRRFFTLTLALACSIPPADAAAQDEGLRLKLEKHLRLAPTRPERDSAKFLEAERIEGQQDRSVTATGNVVLRQRGATIRADRVEYFADDQRAVASGNVQLEREGDTATGPSLVYRLDTDTGEMESPVFEFPRKEQRRVASRGLAKRAVLEENQKSRLIGAEYTSCPAPRNDWFLRVGELQIDSSRNVGTAHDTTVFFLGVPILYSPYLSFALDNKRKTGFLAPTLGTSGKSGFEFSLPYYWNIAENLDATVTPKVYTKRGVQLGGEFRDLAPTYAGQIEGEYLPHDRIRDMDRYFIGVRHAHQLWPQRWPGWSAAVNAQRVSDDDYFRDLSTKIAATSQTNLTREASVNYGSDLLAFTARVLGYQTLQDPLAPVPIPYRIVPQLVASGVQENMRGLDGAFFSELANFRHPTLVNGQRFILYPSVAYPFRKSYGYVTPRFGYHYTRYNVDQNSGGLDDAGRAIPISSVDAGLFFDRPFQWGNRAFLQTLEPRLYYLNVPYRDQSRLPNFTTAEADFNFTSIFTDNRFVGGDRIGDANQLTLALTTRLIESATGLERFKGALGQIYYYRPQRVTLAGPPRDDKSSDILALASSQMSPSVTFDAGWQYTPSVSRSEKITVAAHYLPVPGKIINAAYRYARNDSDRRIEQVDFSTQWPVGRNISALGRWNWSLEDRKLVEGLAGFEYNAGCWQVRAVAHRFITATQQYSTSFLIQLELSGLSRIGINPLETIRQNISGYRRSDEIAPGATPSGTGFER
jgi:LPS-assembly protein